MSSVWVLRRAQAADASHLHDLASQPPVYRFLFDESEPARGRTDALLQDALAHDAQAGLGMWFLRQDQDAPCGMVQLSPGPDAGSAQLIYLLHPRLWGQGLATRMGWSVIAAAFAGGRLDCIMAGVDGANAASRAVLGKLGMRMLRLVTYPLGPGMEFCLTSRDPGPLPPPAVLPMRG